jgi:hypothetical protein
MPNIGIAQGADWEKHTWGTERAETWESSGRPDYYEAPNRERIFRAASGGHRSCAVAGCGLPDLDWLQDRGQHRLGRKVTPPLQLNPLVQRGWDYR